ncbi:hypothetical protein HHL17_09905 [Chitinophaga sp. G-6-1-13]|uniref:Uncharacterized protein n=1 Tax=Chitinophaga fulva TaxID=2728842 RepID=A0A848GL18_9BACT|nr:hypothetical protein [Chitinophaga fulva]NML37503.1 hypothetical protein [Chitinophaga fulva]
MKMQDILQSSFTLEKLRLDLFGYLNDMNYTMDSKREYCISVPNIDTSICAELILSQKDDIHVIKYIANYNVIGGLHYYITVGIGNYIEYADLGLFTVDKCLVELKYNDDLTFYDAELYIEELSRQH